MASFTGLISNVLVAWFCCLLPAFQTFKALTHRPVLEPLLERWCKYWTIIGVIFAYQNTVEPFVSWIPFYWGLKSSLLIFMALPQTEGSTYIYDSFFKPYLLENEESIDTSIEAVQTNAFAFLTEKLQVVWQVLYRALTKSAAPGQGTAGSAQPTSQAPAPSIANVMGVLQTYGPSFLQSFKTKTANGTASTPAPQPAASAASSSTDVSSATARTPYQNNGDPIPASSPPFPEPQHFS